MTLRNFAIINHPVRMRIFQTLNHTEMSINQLAQHLADVPKPSLYRHIRLMLDAGIVQVTRVRYVHGIEERFYMAVSGLIDPASLDTPEGLQQFADHVRLYGSGVAQALAEYALEAGKPAVNNIAARDHFFYATEEEFLEARETIYAILRSLEANSPGEGRVKRRMFVMSHPLLTEPTET
ncbi:helix-turn-helix domain-containing protein [Chloroflexus sp.]|uniref:helix-turn-helix domain-containing protein n=1 Tax=Chloroflexus sp. TaxID=1904827 RepID=UPI002615C4BB|nr:helix-turn-helix domain-containing protein [uncultured Chloroflexus sp.]